VLSLSDELEETRKLLASTRVEMAISEFKQKMDQGREIGGVEVLSTVVRNADADTLRQLTDLFKQKFSSGIVAVGSVVADRPMIVCAVTEDLVKRGIQAGSIVKEAASLIGGSGGGRPNMAQAGGKDSVRLPEAMDLVYRIVDKLLQ